MQTADSRLGLKCRLSTKCRLRPSFSHRLISEIFLYIDYKKNEIEAVHWKKVKSCNFIGGKFINDPRPVRYIGTPSEFNPLTAEGALRALIAFTLSNARLFYLSMGNPWQGKR